MITINDKKIHLTPQQARNVIQDHTNRCGVFIDLDRVFDYRTGFIEKMKPLERDIKSMSGNRNFKVTVPADLVRALIDRFGVSEYSLKDRGGNVTASAPKRKELLEGGQLNQDAREFLTLFEELKKFQTLSSTLATYANLPMLACESFENHRMVIAKPEWNVLNTGRIGASNPAVQNLSKDLCDLVTYPKWLRMVRADSGQIEPRITYSHYIPDPLLKELIIAYDDAYYGMLRFILMTDEEEIALRHKYNLFYKGCTAKDLEPNREIMLGIELKIELAESARSDLKVLLLAGNYGGDLSRFDPILANGFTRKIQNHPLRKQWEYEVKEAVRDGQEVFYSYFGTPIRPGATAKYEVGGKGWRDHLVRCGINNPIQTTAADLMCESVYTVDKIIREKAVGDTTIGYYKHDEVLLYVDIRDGHLIPELASCTSYQVEDWITIGADFLEGKKIGKNPYKISVA